MKLKPIHDQFWLKLNLNPIIAKIQIKLDLTQFIAYFQFKIKLQQNEIEMKSKPIWSQNQWKFNENQSKSWSIPVLPL